MRFEIRMGRPNMLNFWNELQNKISNHNANKDEIALHKKLVKAFKLLETNPRHNSLNSHEISFLSDKIGLRVWESYLENKKPAAGRIFWVYYPPGAITIIGISPHPDDNKHSYEKITLSAS